MPTTPTLYNTVHAVQCQGNLLQTLLGGSSGALSRRIGARASLSPLLILTPLKTTTHHCSYGSLMAILAAPEPGEEDDDEVRVI